MNGSGHISIYLAIVDTEKYTPGWEIYVSFKLFLFDQIQHKFLMIHGVHGRKGLLGKVFYHIKDIIRDCRGRRTLSSSTIGCSSVINTSSPPEWNSAHSNI